MTLKIIFSDDSDLRCPHGLYTKFFVMLCYWSLVVVIVMMKLNDKFEAIEFFFFK